MAGTIKGITIEIDGKTTKLKDALRDVDKPSRDLQASLTKVNKALKFDPSNTELLSEKQKILASYVDTTRDKLQKMEAVQDQIRQQYANGEIDQGAYLDFQRELEQTRSKLKDLEDQQKQFGSVLEQQMKIAGEKVSEFGGKVEDAGKKLAPLSAAAGGVLVGTTKMASDFTDAMAKVNTIADTSKVSLGDIEDQILELSNATGISASEIADAVYNAISAGQDTADAVNFVSNATSLARAGFTDTASSIDILTTILNAYGLESAEATSVCDKLITTQNLGKTTVGELASAMGKVIPTAKSQNVELDELCGAYAVMTANGIATAESTTYLNSMLNELGKQGTSAAKAFAAGTEHIKEGGLTMAEAMEQGWSLTDVLAVLDGQAQESGTSISNMFGSAEAGKAASVLLDNAEKLDTVVAQMGDSAEATAGALEKLETPSHTVDVAINQVKNSGIELGQTVLEALAPALESVSGIIEKVTSGFSALSPETKTMVASVLALAAGLSPVLLIGGKLISGVGSMIEHVGKARKALSGLGSVFSFLAANPAVLIVAAIAGIIAGLVTAYNKSETFRDFVNSAFEAVKETVSSVVEAVIGFVDGLCEAWDSAAAWVSETWDSAMNLINNVTSTVMTAVSGTWNSVTSSIKQVTSDAMSAASKAVKEKLDNIQRAYQENGGGIQGIAAATMEAVRGLYDSGWAAIDTLTGGKLSDIRNTISDKMASARQAVSDAIDAIKGKFNFQWNWPKLKMPHFSISGSFSLNPPSVPRMSVQWYAKGGILNGAQIFGALGDSLLGGGEAGKEAVLPLDSFYDNLRSILAGFIGKASAGTAVSVELRIDRFENRSDRDLDDLVDYVEDQLQSRIRKREAAIA